MAAIECPEDLPGCVWCERRERNVPPGICYHLPGAPTDRARWFERKAEREDKADVADEMDARRERERDAAE